MVDTYKDIRIKQNRDIELTAEGDIALTTSRDENIAQSVSIHVSNAVSQIIGGPVNEALVQQLESDVKDHIDRDPQVSDVLSVTLTEVNQADNSITVDIKLQNNTTFTLPIYAN